MDLLVRCDSRPDPACVIRVRTRRMWTSPAGRSRSPARSGSCAEDESNVHRLSAMTSPNEQGRPEPPVAGDETATLLGSLERQRATLAWKCGGLDAAGLRATLGASSMTLGGLLKHLAL